MIDVVRDEKGRIRSKAQQEASRLLFGDPTYAPKRQDDVQFVLRGEWITYPDLVKRLEKAVQ